MAAKRILVAGGTGTLGSAVVRQLKADDARVRVLSSKPPSADVNSPLEWAQADVISGEGIADALNDVDIIVNCLGNPRNAYAVDVLGVKQLAERAAEKGVQHFFHISIVGIEQIDLEYYRHKQEAEAAIAAAAIPYSIQRLTQFHTLIDFMLSAMKHENGIYTLPLAADARFQPIDTSDAAAFIAQRIQDRPAGRLPDIGGPEILRIDEMARIFLQAKKVHNPVFVDPDNGFFPPPSVEGFKQGFNTVTDNRTGHITWSQYIHDRYSNLPQV